MFNVSSLPLNGAANMPRINPFLLSATVTAYFAFADPGQVLSQNYEAMIQQQLQQGNAMADQMRQMEQGIVQRNMQNPQVQAMYQNYINSGGTMSFEAFSYNYAATAGFTPEGKAYYNQNENNIRQREMDAVNRYRQSQAENAQVLQQMHQGADNRARAVGNLMSGTSDYTDPGTGAQYNLPRNNQPDSYYHDQGTGQTFYNDPSGNYYREDPNGYRYELDEDD